MSYNLRTLKRPKDSSKCLTGKVETSQDSRKVRRTGQNDSKDRSKRPMDMSKRPIDMSKRQRTGKNVLRYRLNIPKMGKNVLRTSENVIKSQMDR